MDVQGRQARFRSTQKPVLPWLIAGIIAFLLILYNPLSGAAVRFNQESMVGGTAIYGTLRALNSLMSVAKDADIQGSVAVASATFSPGQLLEPVTNTIDRIADLLFVLIIGSGLVAALTKPLAIIGAAVAFGSSLGISSMRLLPVMHSLYAESLFRSLFVIGFIATAVIPGAFAGASLLGDQITRGAWENATNLFEGMETKIDDGTSEDALTTAEAIAPANEQAAASSETPPSDDGVIGGTLSSIGSAWSASRSAVTDTAKAATGLASSIRNQAASNVKIIRDGVAFSGHLLDASVQIAVAYLAKLVILPIMIFGAAIFLLRSAPLPAFPRHASRIENV